LADLIGERPVNGKIRCVFHADDDTPSLHIYRDHYHCFSCGAHGGHLDWLREVDGLDIDAAVDAIFHWQGRTSSPRQENDARTLKLALALWTVARPITNTPAIRYLAEVRGIDVEALPFDVPLRFHPRCTFGTGKRLPCLLALYQDIETDEFAGIHRIALTQEVFAGGEVERRSLACWPRPRCGRLDHNCSSAKALKPYWVQPHGCSTGALRCNRHGLRAHPVTSRNSRSCRTSKSCGSWWTMTRAVKRALKSAVSNGRTPAALWCGCGRNGPVPTSTMLS
jgi:hypothetical protein